MLSFGYSLLHHHAMTALREAGLQPQIGIFHRPSERFAALAADLQEELRWLVDALVVGLVRRGEMVAERDFVESAAGAFWLTWEARKQFLQAFEERLLTEFQPPSGAKRSYRELLFDQAVQLREVITGRLPAYVPLRIEA